LICLFAGLCTGAVGGYFQFFLHKADHLRMLLTTVAHSVSFWEGFGAVLAVCVACAVIGRFLVRFAPTAGGSGIQYVEAAWREEVEPARFKILLVKFFGGILTLGSGMALGREGPTVQYGGLRSGATIARILKFSKESFVFSPSHSAGYRLRV